MKLKQLTFIFPSLPKFYLLYTHIDAKSVIHVLSTATRFCLLLSLLVLAVVKRLQIFLKITGHSFPFLRCFTIFMAALPLTFITPFKSGDLVKAYFILKWNFSIFRTCVNLIDNVVEPKQK